jgi:sterol desaturase/sphingolipid hydroxylase (fatty acid hydroxylase superfamily)
MNMARSFIENLMRDLEAPIEARGFGTGWFSGFFALLFAAVGLCFAIALRWPGVLATPELAGIEQSAGFRVAAQITLVAGYALALLSLMLRPRKALGFAALAVSLAASLIASLETSQARPGLFFGVDFFAVNLVATGLMFAPLERLFPHRREQRLFRREWREDLFYFLVSSMMVQLLTFLALTPSQAVNASTGALAEFRAAVAAQPFALQLLEAMFLTDLAQYWFHRAFHRIPFLWGFHAVHHSAPAMDWLAGARMHFVEIALLRGVTSLPLLTLGFSPAVMQTYIGLVYVYSSLVHANLKGDFDMLGQFLVTPRFHHWHHGLEKEAIDVNFAIHFPWLDRMFGTYHFPPSRWPKAYGVPEKVPDGYLAQFMYPFRRRTR